MPTNNLNNLLFIARVNLKDAEYHLIEETATAALKSGKSEKFAALCAKLEDSFINKSLANSFYSCRDSLVDEITNNSIKTEAYIKKIDGLSQWEKEKYQDLALYSTKSLKRCVKIAEKVPFYSQKIVPLMISSSVVKASKAIEKEVKNGLHTLASSLKSCLSTCKTTAATSLLAITLAGASLAGFTVDTYAQGLSDYMPTTQDVMSEQSKRESNITQKATSQTQTAAETENILLINTPPSLDKDYAKEIRLKNPEAGKKSLAMRNNNPMNLKKAEYCAEGQLTQGAHEFQKFSSLKAGFAAAYHQLVRYQTTTKFGKPQTPRQIIAIWAPSSENDVNSYVERVGSLANIDMDAKIDVTRDTQKTSRLMCAMFLHESGCDYSDLLPVAYSAVTESSKMLHNGTTLPSSAQEALLHETFESMPANWAETAPLTNKDEVALALLAERLVNTAIQEKKLSVGKEDKALAEFMTRCAVRSALAEGPNTAITATNNCDAVSGDLLDLVVDASHSGFRAGSQMLNDGVSIHDFMKAAEHPAAASADAKNCFAETKKDTTDERGKIMVAGL